MVLLNAKQLSELLQVRPHRVYELVRQNLVPHVKLGKQVRFSPDAIADWIREGGSSLDGKLGGGTQ